MHAPRVASNYHPSLGPAIEIASLKTWVREKVCGGRLDRVRDLQDRAAPSGTAETMSRGSIHLIVDFRVAKIVRKEGPVTVSTDGYTASCVVLDGCYEYPVTGTGGVEVHGTISGARAVLCDGQ